MNLDRWLIRVPPQETSESEGPCAVDLLSSSPRIPLTPLELNSPPAKRQKLAPPPFPATLHRKLCPLPSATLARRKVCLGEYVPMEMFNYYEARKTCQTQSVTVQSVPFCVTSLHTQARAFVGFQSGMATLVDTDPNSEGIVVSNLDTGTNNAVRDASCSIDDSVVICGTDLGVLLWDCNLGKIGLELSPENDVGFRQVEFSPQANIFATGTQSGNVYIMDRRQPQPSRTILNAHRIDKRVCSSISALTWLDSTTLATAGTHNDVAKVWDMRHTRKCLDQTAPSQRSGIASMTVDAYNQLWLLRRNGSLFATAAGQPNYELQSAHLRSCSSYSRLEFVSESTTGSSTHGNYLVCSGSKDLVMFVAPTRKAMQKGYDFSSTAVLLKGHTRETTGLSWHPMSNCLLSVSDDFTLRYWRVPDCPL